MSSCPICRKTFAPPHRIGRPRVYCSDECRDGAKETHESRLALRLEGCLARANEALNRAAELASQLEAIRHG